MVQHFQSTCNIDVSFGGTLQQYWSKTELTMKPLQNFDVESIYVSNIDTRCHIHKRIVDLMTVMGSELWTTLFSVSKVTN